MLLFFFESIEFMATFAFALNGCLVAEEKTLAHAVPPWLLCSFGGGFFRDAILWFCVSKEAIPVAFSAYTLWLAAGLGFGYYALMKTQNKTTCLHRGFRKWLRLLLDSAGCGRFLVGGIGRSQYFGITNAYALVFFGCLTALGGGFVSLLLFRKKRTQVILGNLRYYATSIIPACAVVYAKDSSSARTTAITLLFCTLVTIIALLCSERFEKKHFTHYITKDPAMGRKKQLWLSPGARFKLMHNPMKGIRLWPSIPSKRALSVHLIVPPAN